MQHPVSWNLCYGCNFWCDLDSHLGIETRGRLVEICEIGEITGKSSEITARGSPLLPLHEVHFILRWITSRGWKRQAAKSGNKSWSSWIYFTCPSAEMKTCTCTTYPCLWVFWSQSLLLAGQLYVGGSISRAFSFLDWKTLQLYLQTMPRCSNGPSSVTRVLAAVAVSSNL